MLSYFSNLLLGVQAQGRVISLSLRQVASAQLFWGLALGLIISTIIHVLIIAERPHHALRMLLWSKNDCIKFIQAQGPTCVDEHVVQHFTKNTDKVKLISSIGLLNLVIVLFLAILFY